MEKCLLAHSPKYVSDSFSFIGIHLLKLIKPIYCCCFSLALFVCCASLSTIAAAPAKKTQWQMKQREFSAGVLTIYFCPTAVKILDQRRGFSIVSKAPDWDVYAIRDDDKSICHMTRQQYYNKNAFKVKHGHTESKVLKTYKIGPVTAPLYYGLYHNDVIKRFDGVPTQVEDLIACFYKATCVDGINLRSISNSVPSKKRDSSVFLSIDLNRTGVTLETMSLEQVPFRETDFEIPANYRQVKDIGQILTGKSKRKEAESIFLDMGVGDDLGKAKTK